MSKAGIGLPDFITFTGVDNKTSGIGMRELSMQYPIEWGILFSPVRQGKHPRFPSLSFIDTLTSNYTLRYSAHLCGDYASEVIVSGESRFDGMVHHNFTRAQLNTRRKGLPYGLIGDWAAGIGIRAIIQVREEFLPLTQVDLLFDPSGGKGIAQSHWPEPTTETYCGYAGGLNPSNVADEVLRMGRYGRSYWIDMETGVRDGNDNFSLDLCRQVCEAVYGKV